MKLILGLGNPGKEYILTRHNIGFMVIDSVVEKLQLGKFKNKFEGLYVEYVFNNEKIIFLKPQSYINLSGNVLRKYVDFFKIDTKDILIVTDDLDLELGKIKLKSSGGSGGHNGLKNIEQILNTNEYKRLKIGISNDKKINTRDYVLGKMDNDELEAINNAVVRSCSIVLDFLENDFLELMNKYNGDRV